MVAICAGAAWGRGPTPPPASQPSAEKAKAGACVERFEVQGRPSVFDELSARGKPAADSSTRYAAAKIDPAKHQPVKLVESTRIDGAPLLYLTGAPPDAVAVVVDARWLSDLTVVDATRLEAGARVRVGQLTAAARGKIGARELTRFLISAGVIRTYWHLGSNLCLEKEDKSDAGYRALYSGVHTYYTSKRMERQLAFAFELAADGTITVAAR